MSQILTSTILSNPLPLTSTSEYYFNKDWDNQSKPKDQPIMDRICDNFFDCNVDADLKQYWRKVFSETYIIDEPTRGHQLNLNLLNGNLIFHDDLNTTLAHNFSIYDLAKSNDTIIQKVDNGEVITLKHKIDFGKEHYDKYAETVVMEMWAQAIMFPYLYDIMNICGAPYLSNPMGVYFENDYTDQLRSHQKYGKRLYNFSTLVKTSGSDDDVPQETYRFTIDPKEIVDCKQFVLLLLKSQSVMINKSYLSNKFKSNKPRMDRIFDKGETAEIPIFCPSAYSGPNSKDSNYKESIDPNGNDYGFKNKSTTYKLLGGQFTADDVREIITDIVYQVVAKTNEDDGTDLHFYTEYKRISEIMGLSKDGSGGQDDFADGVFLIYGSDKEKLFLARKSHKFVLNVPEFDGTTNYPEVFLFDDLMNLWNEWGFPILHEPDHVIYTYTIPADIMFLLLKLFQQTSGERLDIHLLTCLEGNSLGCPFGISDQFDYPNLWRNKTLEHSWEFDYKDNTKRTDKIGPDCAMDKCEDDVTLSDYLDDSLFELEPSSIGIPLREPRHRTTTYNIENSNIEIDQNEIPETKLLIQCKNQNEIKVPITCKQIIYDRSSFSPDITEAIKHQEIICQNKKPGTYNTTGIEIMPEGRPIRNKVCTTMTLERYLELQDD